MLNELSLLLDDQHAAPPAVVHPAPDEKDQEQMTHVAAHPDPEPHAPAGNGIGNRIRASLLSIQAWLHPFHGLLHFVHEILLIALLATGAVLLHELFHMNEEVRKAERQVDALQRQFDTFQDKFQRVEAAAQQTEKTRDQVIQIQQNVTQDIIAFEQTMMKELNTIGCSEFTLTNLNTRYANGWEGSESDPVTFRKCNEMVVMSGQLTGGPTTGLMFTILDSVASAYLPADTRTASLTAYNSGVPGVYTPAVMVFTRTGTFHLASSSMARVGQVVFDGVTYSAKKA